MNPQLYDLITKLIGGTAPTENPDYVADPSMDFLSLVRW